MNELSRQSLADLQRLKKRVDAELARRTDSTQKKLRKEIEKLVAKEGLSLSDVLGEPGSTKPASSKKGKAASAKKANGKGKVKPKYRHPENAEITWTGRGRKPGWVEEQLKAGNTLEQLLIA